MKLFIGSHLAIYKHFFCSKLQINILNFEFQINKEMTDTYISESENEPDDLGLVRVYGSSEF